MRCVFLIVLFRISIRLPACVSIVLVIINCVQFSNDVLRSVRYEVVHLTQNVHTLDYPFESLVYLFLSVGTAVQAAR